MQAFCSLPGCQACMCNYSITQIRAKSFYREAKSFVSHHPTSKHQVVLRLRIATTSMPEYVSGWCGHGFDTRSQPFFLAYFEADLGLWRSVFYFQIRTKLILDRANGELHLCGRISPLVKIFYRNWLNTKIVDHSLILLARNWWVLKAMKMFNSYSNEPWVLQKVTTSHKFSSKFFD